MKTKKKPNIIFTDEKKKKGTLAALGKVKDLLSDKDRWIKGDFLGSNEVDGEAVDAYCLLGAAQYINGPYEVQVQAVMTEVLVPGSLHRVDLNEEDISDYNEAVMKFNDTQKRKHQDIIKFLETCISTVKTAKVQKEVVTVL